MMPLIDEVMLAVSSSLAASIVVKATLVMALALLCAWMARRSCAAVRHALMAAAFGVLLALPVASIVAPPIRIAVPQPAQQRIVPVFAEAAILPVARAHASVSVTPVVPRASGLLPSALLLTAWIAGTMLFLLPVVVGLWQVRRLRRSALPWRDGQSMAEKLALEAGIHRRIEVLLHESLPGPMTCGIVHPSIVLSPDAQTWQEEDLNRALIHELEHVRRGDWLSLCLARAVCAIYWFHPLVWVVWRQFALAAERSCDDAVLGRSEPTAYADQLVALARRLSSAKSPMLAMANRADLSARVGAVLDGRQRRGRAGIVLVALACAAAAVVIAAMSPLTMVAAEPASVQSAEQSSLASATPQFDAAPVKLADASVKSSGSTTHSEPKRISMTSTAVPARPAVLIAAVSPLEVAAAQQQAASPERAPVPRFSNTTNLVVEAVTVSDQNGKTIEGLSANDFAITEDGVPQTISFFEFQKLTAPPAPATPASVSSYYILGYYTSNQNVDGAFRKIGITSVNTTARLDYRPGYYANKRFAFNGSVSGGSISSVPGNGVINDSIGPDASPVLISKREPEYSLEARKAKFQGSVTLQVVVDENGSPINPRVMKSLGLGLDEKAIEAVKHWKFRPGMKDGRPVAMPVEVEVSFRLL